MDSAHVLFKIPDGPRAWNGEKLWPLSHDPGENRLGWGAASLGGQMFEDFDEVQVLGEVFGAKSWEHVTLICFLQVVQGFELAGQEASAEG